MVDNLYQRSEVYLEEELTKRGGELGPGSIQGKLELHQFKGAGRVLSSGFEDVLPFGVEIGIPKGGVERLTLPCHVARHPWTFVDFHL